MYACIILNNMIIEHELKSICTYDDNNIVNPDQQFILGSIGILTIVVEIQNVETCQYL